MMRKARFLWTLYISYAVVVVLAIGLISVYSSRAMKKVNRERATSDLIARLQLIARELPPTFPNTPEDSLFAFCREHSAMSGMRLTLISLDRRFLADSDSLNGASGDVSFETEILRALEGETSTAVSSIPLGRSKILHAAIPIMRGGEVLGAIRASLPLQQLSPELRGLNLRLLIAGVAIALLAALVTLVISRWISRPVAEMEQGAERFAAGDFSHKVAVPRSAELGGLASALNNMAAQLDDKIRAVTTQRNEQEAILSSLREAVIAVDTQDRILFMNRAAASILDIDASRSLGRLLPEVVRNSDIQEFIAHLLSGRAETAETEATLIKEGNRTLQISGTILSSADGQRLGVVVVFNDITRLRRLETVRKDFVANVSHELKTPVTSIKGFVEALREGALGDPQTAQSFLERIAANAERLNAIIDDLLTLARVEQEGGQQGMLLEPGNLYDVVAGAIAAVQAMADERQVKIEFARRDGIQALLNPTLLEQAVINLLDNAVKYSTLGGRIEVDVTREDGNALISVTDHGIGISREHLPRLFERFYRVDKARSRKLGGTGLGLSIVRHIVLAHRGTVSVDSAPGKGSTFIISIPIH